MKLNALLMSTVLAAGSMMTVNAHADSTARVAAARKAVLNLPLVVP